MTHDIISMSAGLTEGENKRILVVSFDPRIDTEAVMAFTRQSLFELVFKSDSMPKFVCDPKPPRGSTSEQAQHEPVSERDKAFGIAEGRFIYDPGSDAALLSRVCSDAIRKISRLSKILDGLLDVSDERNSPLDGYTIEDLQREAADRWPTPTEANE